MFDCGVLIKIANINSIGYCFNRVQLIKINELAAMRQKKNESMNQIMMCSKGVRLFPSNYST